jgi:hypothetical protein
MVVEANFELRWNYRETVNGPVCVYNTPMPFANVKGVCARKSQSSSPGESERISTE